MRHRFVRATALAFAFSYTGVVSAQQGGRPADLTGSWHGKLTLDGIPHSVTLQLTQRDSTVVGTFSDNCWVVRDHQCVEDGSEQIDRTRIAGDTLTFVVDALEFSGVVSGSMIRLTVANPYDNSRQAFVAVRVPPGRR